MAYQEGFEVSMPYQDTKVDPSPGNFNLGCHHRIWLGHQYPTTWGRVVLSLGFFILHSVILFFCFCVRVAYFLFLRGKDSCFVEHVRLVPYQRS